MTKTITIIVKPSGQTIVETKGFAGASCQDASKFIELALGRRSGARLTPEFFQTAETEAQRRQQN